MGFIRGGSLEDSSGDSFEDHAHLRIHHGAQEGTTFGSRLLSGVDWSSSGSPPCPEASIG